LAGSFLFPIGEMFGLLKQVVGIWQSRSRPSGLI
jgi:hypothetical protein